MDEVPTTPVSVRLPVEMRKTITRMSEAERRSLSNQIVVLLEKALATVPDPIESPQTTKDGGRE